MHQLWNGIAQNYIDWLKIEDWKLRVTLPVNRRSMHALFSVCSLRDNNVITSKLQTYIKTEAYKPYSGVFEIFLPSVIKIDPYNFELYHFIVGETQRRKWVLLSRRPFSTRPPGMSYCRNVHSKSNAPPSKLFTDRQHSRRSRTKVTCPLQFAVSAHN